MSEKIDTIAYPMLQQNKNILYASKVITSIGSGIVSGALGLVHYQGIVFMAICYLIITSLLVVKLLPNIKNTFTSLSTVVFEAFFPFIMVCLLFIIYLYLSIIY